MTKWLFSDFDDTLKNDRQNKGELDPRDVQFVKEWQDQGNKFVITTGRPYPVMKKYFSTRDVKPDAFICLTSAVIYVNDEPISISPIEGKLKSDINAMVKKFDKDIKGVAVSTIQGDVLLFHDDWNERLRTHQINMDPLGLTIDSSNDYDVLIYKLFAPADTWLTTRAEFEKIDNIIIHHWKIPEGFYIEVMSATTRKENGIRKIQELYGFEDEDIIVAGDDINDWSMFEEFKDNAVMVKHKWNVDHRDKVSYHVDQIFEIKNLFK
ncbi:HAD-IIB family hydrolase [[Acholeplasma] multilocale]|uniref:HAD-IIB family hydrolase n=1 Tax=[Acholeplasma] multilocale TaxID=264638 RepID=UPI00047B1EF6|nr:HAD-IIB family hydrolase [[Acholeplasma] multilocale]